MNKYLKNNISLILKIFLYLNPILDLITSIMINYLNISFTIGMIIRFIFLFVIVYYYLYVKKDNNKRNYFIIGLLYIISFVLLTLYNKGFNALSYEVVWLLKIIYFIVLLIFINKEDVDIKLEDFINVGLLYLSIIFMSNILSLSFNSYTQGKIGSVGLFNSGNEISAILSILNPLFIYYLFNKNNIYKKIVLVILMLSTYFNIGSKIIIISLLVSIIYNVILVLKNKNLNKKYLVIGIILLVLSICIIPRTNIYYNIILHLNYLGINSFKDIFSYNFFNRFIFSDRLTYLINTNDIYIKSSILEKLLGIGFIHNYSSDLISFKMIEMDFFDIFYSLGIIGFLIYLKPLIKGIKTMNNKLFKFSVIMSLIMAFLMGHTLVAPSVSIFILYMIKYKEKVKL